MHLASNVIDFETLDFPDNFELQELIGEGTYGEVYAAIDIKATENASGNSRVAIKILENLYENMEEAEMELHILRDLSIHPNLPTFYGIYMKKSPRLENSQLWYVMEMCDGGSVTDLVLGLKKFEGRKLSETQIAYILKEVIDALSHLHTHHCMHRDIKGHNILLTMDGRIKLIDFGVAYQLEKSMDRRNTSIGTPFYMAPEVIACERQVDSWYDIRCDIWSLGITSIELAEGEPPLSDVHPMRALFQIPRNPPPTLTKPDEWSRDFNDFISECLIKDFEQRPFAIELTQHPFLLQLAKGTDSIRQLLTIDIQLMKTHSTSIKRREPEVSTKYGKLKTNRKSGLHTMFVDDLASLPTLNEEVILNQLLKRYEQNSIYTYIGDILIAVNPNEDIGIYTDFYQYRYRGSNTSDFPPHIFGFADQTYHSMLHQKQCQNIVITGESASGKTETAKLLLQQFVYLGKAPNRNIETKILQLDPILQAFGNAATGANLNSSRFGKYLDITFTKAGKVTGAYISVYLLEESRIDHQAQYERNFHIFYYLLENAMKHELKLEKNQYNYLTYQNDLHKEENVQKFEAVINGFYILGFREEEINSIYGILAAILHLGEIGFETSEDEEGCIVQNSKSLDTVASLLGISSGDLGLCLTTRNVVTGGESFLRRHTSMEAKITKDTLARGLYNRLFRWIVNQINALLGISRIVYGDPLSIGILDIFGLENCQTNSLEQFFINVTNEQLQYFFNKQIFVWEQQEYMAEGIDVEMILYADNRPILELCLGKPLGILSILDQESRFHRTTEATLLDKLNFNLAENKFYGKSASSADCSFTVRHYAGKFVYKVKDFLKKNRNWQSADLIEVLRNSQIEVISTLYRCLLTKTGQLYVSNSRESTWQMKKEGDLDLSSQTGCQQTVSTTFRHSLADLMSKLLSGDPHFIRCIKPNDSHDPNNFDRHKVLKQLRYGGILEAVKIRQLGYSHRFNFTEFLKRYCFLAFGFDERVVADRESCRLLLLRLKMDGWALGRTKVFLKYYHVEYLSKLCERQIKSIIFVQSCIRRWLAKLKIKKGRMYDVAKTIVAAQKAAKIWVGLTGKEIISAAPNKKKKGNSLRLKALGIEEFTFEDDIQEEKAAILIQSRIRGFLARKKHGPSLDMEEKVKKIVMSIGKEEDAREALKKEGLDEEDAALVLQRFYRKWKQQKSTEENGESSKETPLSLVESWDYPFLLIEEQMRDERAGRKAKRREKVDMAAYRKELIMAGLQSQDLANKEREEIMERKWTSVMPNVTGGEVISKFGKQLFQQALEKKVQAIRENSKADIKSHVRPLRKTELVLKKIGSLSSQSDSIDYVSTPSTEENQSLVDFRKLLRKTDHGPTNSLRRRNWNSEDNGKK